MQAYETAKWDSDSKLMPYNPGVEDDGVLVAVADNLAYEIEQTFQASTIDRAPAWVEQQRRGVVNVIRYETRQPGDAEFYRAWVDDDAPGYRHQRQHPPRLQRLDGRQHDQAWPRRATPPSWPVTGSASPAPSRCGTPTPARCGTPTRRCRACPGSTRLAAPTRAMALADLDNQRLDKDKHIVLIFTDGSWDGGWGVSKHLGTYKDEGRYFITFILDDDDDMASLLDRYGSDESYVIQDLMEIPRRLEVAL